MEARYLADSNVIIDLVLGRLPPTCARWLDRRLESQNVYLSVVNRIELLVKTEPAAEHAVMQQFVHSVTVLPFDEPVIWETIQLRQQQKVTSVLPT
jgi:predicted nucleic acid-binding protein